MYLCPLTPIHAGRRRLAVGLVAPVLLAALSTVTSSSALAGAVSATPWIVELKPDANVSEVLRSPGARLGVKSTHEYSHLLNGFSASLTSQQRRALATDSRVAAIVPDQVVHATGDPASEAQPGVRRVGALQNSARNGATLDVDIAIVDTGIQPDHPDLNVVGGYNCTGGSTSAWGDGTSFGHGTHVAGIAAARNNGSGVEGVAAGARLWSIKVLTNSGLGYWSWVICGLDHVASMDDPSDPSKPRIEVVNMSLAGGGFDDGNCGNSNGDPMHQAVCRLERVGVTMVVAAGNAGANAMNYIPAAYDEVITVSGMADYDGLPGGNSSPPLGCAGAGGVNSGQQGDDKFATFSDYGPDVDVIAPAVCILSTLPNSSYGRMTGTSMATPHVTGGAALFYLTEKNAGHARPTTREVRAALRHAGSTNWKTGSDPDGSHEPLLDVSSFNIASDYEISSTPQVKLATGGGSSSFDIWLARLGGFGGAVNISVVNSTLPNGANANVDENASGLPHGAIARVTINLPGSVSAGTYNIQVRGTSGGTTRSTTVRVIVEPGANGGPWMDIRSTQTSGFAIPVQIKWSAGGGNYQLQRSRNGGAWETIANTSATSLSTAAWPGSRCQFRVRSGTGAWKYGASSVVVPEYPSADVNLTGTWSRDANFSSYGELPVYSTQAGARATLNFTGRAVAWIASEGPMRGRANVSLDGNFITQVDLYRSSNRNRQIVFTHSWPSFGSHTLRIDVLGLPASHKRIDIDALLIVAH
jgi:subtilisin family serine protease